MYFLQLKILGIQGSNNFKLVETALKSLSAQEATSALVTTTLTDAEKIRILISKGVTEAEAKKILATAKSTAANVAAAGSTNILTAAWLKLKAAVKGVITTIQAHPILATLAATAAAIGIVIAAYKKANPSTETLAKNLDESKQKIQESTQKITEMESELEKVQSRIDELQSMGSLTIVEQKELSNLKESNALLTRNLELEKQKRRLENKQANENFIKWFDSAMGHKSGLEQSAAIATSVPQPTGDPIANGLGNAVNYLLNKNKDDIYEDNATIGNKFKQIDKLLEERKTATGERIEEIENSLKEAFDYLKNIDTELNNETKDLDLEYTPDAKKGSQEYEINQRIVEAEEFKNKLLLKTAEYQGGIPEAYEAVLNNTLDSSRFSEAAKEIEKLKTAEDGTTRTSKQFRKALYEAITKSPNGSNIKELANYLEELGMIKVDPEIGVDGITDFSNAIVESIDETDKATQSNLLFADSFSKITSARKAFEEGLSSVETGTEDFTSYADSYEKAMELLNKGYDLDNGVLMAHVERLISDKQLKKLGYDADKVKAYLQEHLKGVFGDKDTDAPGNGLIDKIEKNADENGKIYAKDKNGNIDKTRELASYKDGNWHISDDTKDIEALGKEFGMTTDQILSCIKAMKTFSDVDLNDTETIIKQLKEENKVFSVTDKTETTNKDGKKTTKKSKKSAVNISQVESDMKASGQYSSKDIFDTIQQLKDDENVITVNIDAKLKSPKVAEELEKLGIFSDTGTYGTGKSKWTSTTTTDIDKATEALKTFGLTGQEAYEKLKGLDIYETQKDGTKKFLADVEKIESVIKTFSSDFDLNDFTTIWKTDNGKWVENVINVKSLRDTLAEQGWESSTIDAYIQGLKKEAEKSSNKIVIDTDINFEEDSSALTSVEEMLAKAGVAKKDGDVYTVDVEQTIKLLQSNNTSSDDATAFLQNLQAQADKANSSLKLEFTTNASTIEGAISNVYTGAAEVKNNIDAANVSLDTYNNKDLSGIREQLGTTADEAYRNATGLSSTNNEADKLNGREITYSVIKNEITNTGGTGDANGTANISGTALAGGNWGTAPGGKTLTGELGEEIVVNPHTGRWWTVGTHGAEFVDIPKNAIVFNHKQSEALLKNGNIFSRGKALAGGTALSSGTKSKLTSGGNNNSSSSKSSSSSTSSNNSSKSSSSDDKTKIDWIEVAVNRVKRSLENFSNVMDDASRTYKRRLKNLERVKGTTNEQIDLQTSAYNRYMREANAVNLSSSLKAKVRNGDISIGSYSDDTQKAIKEYQELYEKALDSADAIRELKRSLSDIYETTFTLNENKYDNKLSNLQYRADMRQSKMDLRDSQGKVARVKDYEYLIKNAGKQQELLAEKSKKLTEVLNEAVSSGAIKKGGEQYYAYLNKIRDVNKELADSKVSVQEFKNSIKDAYVTRFEQKATKYDRKLNSNEYKSNAAQSRIDLAEANGWRANVADYVSLIKIETANQKILAEKSKKLQNELDRALKSGYLDKTMDEYWDMIDQIESVNQKLADSKVAVANFNSNLKNLKIENFNDVVEGFNLKLDSNTHEQNIQQGKMDLLEAQGKEVSVSDIQKLIDLEWKRQFISQDEVKRLKAELKDSGFKPGTKEYKELESAINSAEEAVLESNIRIETLNNNIKELNMQKFNDTAEKYNRWIYPREEGRDRADRANQMLESQGRFASEYNYRVQFWYDSEIKGLLTKEYQELYKSLGEYEMYSDEWFERYTKIQDVLTAIDNYTIRTIEDKNAIRELNDEFFDYKMDRVSQITSENDFLLSLLENEKQFDDEGNPTKYYDAAMGAHAVNYNVYMDKATEYAKEIENLNSEIASDPSNKKLIERREKLLGLQQDSIKAAQDEKNAMVSLVKEGIEAQLNSLSKLISKYKDSLNSAKDLYDYQKRIKEQTKNIAELEKQLSAYSNDTSEETKAKIQKIKVDLEAARSDLKDTEYDKYISDQEELLDDLYDNYEKLLNEKVDDVNAVVKEQIANVNMNQDDIANTLKEISQRENYNYTDTLEAIYNGVNAIASDKSNGGSETSSTDRTIYEILSEYDRQKQESEDWSKNEGTPSTQLEKEERAKEDEKNREKNDLLNSISSLKNELINALKSGKMKDWSEAEKYNSKANELLKLRDEAVDKGYLSRTSDEYKEISQLQSDVHKEYANAFWNSGTPTTPDDPVDPNWSEQPEPEPPKQSSSTTSTLNTPEAKEQPNKLQQDKKQFDDLQKKLSAALKSGDLKKNPKKYKKDLNLLKTALDTVIKSGIYKKSDAEYKNALSTYNAANKIINPPKTPKKIKVGGKINAGKAKIYAAPGGKATTQYFGDDPIYIVLAEKNGYIQVRYHKAKSGSSGWFKKSDVKAYKYGGLVDETGFAWLDGTPGKPETVLDAEDSKNLMSLRDALQEMARKQGGISLAADYSKYRGLVNSTMINTLNGESILSNLRNSPANVENSVNNTFGDTVINIDHVEDYNDFMTKIRDDKKFEKMITAMTVGKLTGGSSLAKNKYSWK